jgi:hypothetical protein
MALLLLLALAFLLMGIGWKVSVYHAE